MAETRTEVKKSPLDSVDRQIECREKVDVVAADGAVDEVLGQWEGRDKGQCGVDLRTHVRERIECGLEILQVT